VSSAPPSTVASRSSSSADPTGSPRPRHSSPVTRHRSSFDQPRSPTACAPPLSVDLRPPAPEPCATPGDRRHGRRERIGAVAVVGVPPVASAPPAAAEVVSTVDVTFGSGPKDIVAGPDGNLWFTQYAANRIGRLTPSGVVTDFSVGIPPGFAPYRITAGPDGNLWFTSASNNSVGRITPAGAVTVFSAGISVGASLDGIAAGPDGNLWFTEFNLSKIGRITPSGTVTEFTVGIRRTPGLRDRRRARRKRFTEYVSNRIGRIHAGVATEYSG
jgi:streptogramin lyase